MYMLLNNDLGIYFAAIVIYVQSNKKKNPFIFNNNFRTPRPYPAR